MAGKSEASPGTQPVFLIAGLGKAVDYAKNEFGARQDHLEKIRALMVEVMTSAGGILNSSKSASQIP